MTTEIVADASTLTRAQAELQARARAFVEEVLMALEEQLGRATNALAWHMPGTNNGRNAAMAVLADQPELATT
jgi:hypothetical protein